MKAQRYIKNSAQIIDWDNRDAKQSARNGRHDLTYKPQPFAHRIRQQGWGKKKKKKRYLKSEHTGCKIIKALLQTLHKTFLYPLLLREAGK